MPRHSILAYSSPNVVAEGAAAPEAVEAVEGAPEAAAAVEAAAVEAVVAAGVGVFRLEASECAVDPRWTSQ
jgi:hypothetical protein